MSNNVAPKISVIVPCYGVEKYLDRCMKSLIEQTLADIEIILVDDQSPDSVPDMCDQYARVDSRVKVVHKNNGGLGLARNTGLEIATGEYVAFVDSDDYVEISMYEQLYDEAILFQADVVFSNFFIETKPGFWVNSQEVLARTEWSGAGVESFILDMIACEPIDGREHLYQMSVWHSIYRRSIISENDISFHSEREVLSEDMPFQIDFLKHASRVVYIPDSFYRYCLNSNSLSHSFDVRKFDRARNLYHLMTEQMKQVNEAQCRIDRFYIGYLRARIQELVDSDTSNKNKWIAKACDDLKESQIPRRYPAETLRSDRHLFYKLMLAKRVKFIFALCKLNTYINLLRRL